jgi:multiple sugar transport system substrate-binding protein
MRHSGVLRRVIGGCAALVVLTASIVPAAAQQTLRFVSWQVNEPGFGEWWQSVIQEFEQKHEGVTIEFVNVPRDSFADQMTTLFASGSPPEIVHLASFEFHAFADNGWLENLDPYIERSGLDLSEWAGQDRCRWEGQHVCLMMLYFGGIMAYNAALFDEAGIAVPTTYEEHLEAARALTRDLDGDGLIDQYGVGLSTASGPGVYLTELLSYALDAGADWTNAEGDPTFDTPEMAEALGRWKTLIQENLTPLDLAAGDVRQLFIEGRIAMRIDGPWLYGVMRQAEPEIREQLKVAPPPLHPPLGGSSNVLAIPSELDDDTKQLVWEFIELVTSREQQERYAAVAASPAPRPDAVPSDIEAAVPHFDILLQTMKEASAAGVDRIPTGFEVQYNEFSKMVQEEAQRMLIEDLDPADAAARMQERALALR